MKSNSKIKINPFINLFNKTKRFITNLFYYIRTHTYNKYHLIDIRSKEYKWGWIDQDHRIFLACFKCLEEFVEKENPFEVTDYYNDKHHPESAQAGDEIKLLYHWWKEGRFVEELEHKKNKNKPDWDYFGIYERETEMLIRLINIRRYLWT